jgi:hypothetical protein
MDYQLLIQALRCTALVQHIKGRFQAFLVGGSFFGGNIGGHQHSTICGRT